MPVPVSPAIKTGISVTATWRVWRTSSRIGALRERSSRIPAEVSPATSPSSKRFCSFRRRCWRSSSAASSAARNAIAMTCP